MIPRDPSPRRLRVYRTFLFAGLLVIVAFAGTPAPARAVMGQAQALPANPTTCDPVTLVAAGVLSSPCYTIVGATIEGPRPPDPDCMAPICPAWFQIRIVVQEPNPAAEVVCPAVTEPYSRSFSVGQLLPGAYTVRATEYVVPSSPDSMAFPKDSSSAYLSFFVTKADTCPPQLGCVILGFAPSSQLADIALWPSPARPDTISFCTAVAAPGKTGCFNLTLHNEVPAGGLQTEIAIYDPRLDPSPNNPIPSGAFAPVSIGAVGRASGMQAEWAVADGVVKVVLYSASGAAIAAGDGPVLQLCYSVSSAAQHGTYVIAHRSDVVADPEGNTLPLCPTFRETSGQFCVSTPGCDLNVDGVPNILDIVKLVQCVLGVRGGPACPDSVAVRADCNADGPIDVRDIICCVRKILSTAPLGGEPAPAGSGSPVRIGFAGPVRWVTPSEGRTVIEIDPPAGLGGIQFSIDASRAPARVRELRLLEALPGDRLESMALNYEDIVPVGTAVAMIYTERSDPRPAGPIRVEVLLDPTYGTDTNQGIVLVSPLGATTAGDPMPTALGASTAEVPMNPALAPAVFPARPNPFAAETRITFALPVPARASLRVYDVAGRLVRTLADGPYSAGVGALIWNGKDDAGRVVRSGIYFLRLEAAGVTRTGRLLRLR